MLTLSNLISYGYKEGKRTNPYNQLVSAIDRGEISVKDLKSAYSRLRSKVNKQAKTVSKSDVGYAKGETPYFRTLKNMPLTRDLVHEAAQAIAFYTGARYSIAQRRETRDKAIATLAKRGIYLSKNDWMEWVNFMQWFQHSEYAALYDSDSEVVQDIFEQGSTAQEWERAFREWKANNG